MSYLKIPYYREREIKRLYKIFCDENNNRKDLREFDINFRKKEFQKVLKTKYNWINNDEYQIMYKLIKEDELFLAFDFKKREISQKYKKNIIKLFCVIDKDNNNILDLNEFKLLMMKFKICDYDEIENMFKKADTNNDNILSIDEFIDFLTINKDLLERIDEIIECKNDYNRKIDKRNLLFKDFPGSPLKIISNWRPSLANLRSSNSIKKLIII